MKTIMTLAIALLLSIVTANSQNLINGEKTAIERISVDYNNLLYELTYGTHKEVLPQVKSSDTNIVKMSVTINDTILLPNKEMNVDSLIKVKFTKFHILKTAGKVFEALNTSYTYNTATAITMRTEANVVDLFTIGDESGILIVNYYTWITIKKP